MDEEQQQIDLMLDESATIRAYNRVPYSLINQEMQGLAKDTLDELTQICRYYQIYKDGARFFVEGSHGDYVPATLRYKMAASLVDKEARFMFAESPTIVIDPKGDVGKVTQQARDMLTVHSDMVTTILEENNFEEQIIKAAKDCFIGKRCAALINFNEDDGVTITFLPSTQFLYETKFSNPNVITKFVAFIVIKDTRNLVDKRIFKKKFELVRNPDGSETVYLEEQLYDGRGALLEEITKRQELLIPMIPAVVFINDGLTGEEKGESEIDLLYGYEQWYSKLSNADIDAERKSMNSIKYGIDLDRNSTKGLSTAPGSFWDLGTDQNLDKPSPKIGMLEPSMGYSDALKTSLDRIKTVAYEQIDMPNVTLETMTGAITSGKALKAIYWPLIVRCKEKMTMWGPNFRQMVNIIIQGAYVYPKTVQKYISEPLVPVDYEIKVEQNTPLPEDELEERQQDLSEVDTNVMSKRAYMKKWRGLTDDEAQEELEQIAYERQIIEEASFNGGFGNGAGNDGGEGSSNNGSSGGSGVGFGAGQEEPATEGEETQETQEANETQ